MYTGVERIARLAFTAAILFGSKAVVGCGGESNAMRDGAAPEAADAQTSAKCPADTPEFVATADDGLVAVGKHGAIEARVIAADPAMPERFENTWTIRFTDAEGMALSDIDIVDACVFMPAHGHGGKPKGIASQKDPATFVLDGMNLFMRGPWEIQLAVNSASTDDSKREFTSCDRNQQTSGWDLIVFRVCVPDD